MRNALKNRLAVSSVFLLFGLSVTLLSFIFKDDNISYIVSAILFVVIAIVEHLRTITIFRGFAKLALLIIVPSAAFPLAFMNKLFMPEIVLWVCALAMVAAMPVLWWNIAKRVEE